MENINEKFHNPDEENVTKLIDNLLNKIRENTIRNALLSSPMLPPVKDDSGVIKLTPDINPCHWIADDCIFSYIIHFDTDNIFKISKFENYDDLGYIEPGDETFGILPKIHFGAIRIEFCIGKDVYVDGIRGVRERVNQTIDKIKVDLRHELDHAYKELFTQSRFPMMPEYDDSSDDKIDDHNFKEAYDKITSTLFKLRDSNSEEKDLINLLYTSNYVERDAHISGFYQRMFNDAETESIKTIDSYYEYRTYSKNVEFIKKFNNPGLFNKYKEYISYLFGSKTREFPTFKRRLLAKNENIIKKLRSIYNFFDTNKENFKNSNISINEAKEMYYASRKEYAEKLFGHLDENEMGVYDVVTKHYLKSDKELFLNRLEFFFDGI